MQFTSPAVQDGKFTAGDFVISGEDRVAIKRNATGIIVPIMFWLQWIEWHPDRNAPKSQRLIDRSTDPNSKLAVRAGRFEKVKKPDGKEMIAVTEYYNFIIALPELTGNFDELFIFGFSKSSHKVGKLWLNRARKLRTPGGQDIAPIWSNAWELSSFVEQNERNEKYMIPMIGNCKPVDAAWHPVLSEISAGVKAQKAAFADRTVEVEVEATSAAVDDHPM
jgi:hypothetical protein